MYKVNKKGVESNGSRPQPIKLSSICSPTKRLHLINMPDSKSDFYKNIEMLEKFDGELARDILSAAKKNFYVITERKTETFQTISPLGASLIESYTNQQINGRSHHIKAACTYQQISKLLTNLAIFIAFQPLGEDKNIAQKFHTHFEAISIDYRNVLQEIPINVKAEISDTYKLNIDELPKVQKTKKHKKILIKYHETEDTKLLSPTKKTEHNKLASDKLLELNDKFKQERSENSQAQKKQKMNHDAVCSSNKISDKENQNPIAEENLINPTQKTFTAFQIKPKSPVVRNNLNSFFASIPEAGDDSNVMYSSSAVMSCKLGS